MKFQFLIFVLFVILGDFSYSQSLPRGELKIFNSHLPQANGLYYLSSKPEIPYLSELKQINSLKESYDSWRSEIKEIQESAQNSTTQDSILNQAKIRSKALFEKEAQVLEDFAESLDPG